MHHLANVKRRRVGGMSRGFGDGSDIVTPLLRQFGRCLRHWCYRAQRFRDREAGPQSILMESVSGPRPAKPGAAAALDFVEPLLRGESCGIVLRMFADVLAECQRRVRFERGLRLTTADLVVIDALQRFIQ